MKLAKKVEPVMKFEETKTGMGVIRINIDTYLSFGSGTDPSVKYVNIRYPNGGKLFPVELLKLPKNATNAIGTKNLKTIRELIRERLVDGVLPRDRVLEIGEIINSEGKN